MSGDIMILAKDVDYRRMAKRGCYLSEKIDGVPGIFERGKPVLSRQGKPILSVPHIDDVIQSYLNDDLAPVVVGELYVPGKPFKVSSGVIRRQTPQLEEDIKLHIWDVYFPNEPDLGFHARVVKASPWIRQLLRASPLIEEPQVVWTLPETAKDAEEIVLRYFDALVMDRPYRPEGVIIRTHDEPYKLGRSWGLMRYVEKPTIDLEVLAFEEATANKKMTFLGEEFRKGDGLRAVGKIFVRYNHEIVGVGPGCMTHTERRDYFLNPDKLIGKIIKIQYKRDESYKALRQPTFVCIHHDKTTQDA